MADPRCRKKPSQAEKLNRQARRQSGKPSIPITIRPSGMSKTAEPPTSKAAVPPAARVPPPKRPAPAKAKQPKAVAIDSDDGSGDEAKTPPKKKAKKVSGVKPSKKIYEHDIAPYMGERGHCSNCSRCFIDNEEFKLSFMHTKGCTNQKATNGWSEFWVDHGDYEGNGCGYCGQVFDSSTEEQVEFFTTIANHPEHCRRATDEDYLDDCGRNFDINLATPEDYYYMLQSRGVGKFADTEWGGVQQIDERLKDKKTSFEEDSFLRVPGKSGKRVDNTYDPPAPADCITHLRVHWKEVEKKVTKKSPFGGTKPKTIKTWQHVWSARFWNPEKSASSDIWHKIDSYVGFWNKATKSRVFEFGDPNVARMQLPGTIIYDIDASDQFTAYGDGSSQMDKTKAEEDKLLSSCIERLGVPFVLPIGARKAAHVPRGLIDPVTVAVAAEPVSSVTTNTSGSTKLLGHTCGDCGDSFPSHNGLNGHTKWCKSTSFEKLVNQTDAMKYAAAIDHARKAPAELRTMFTEAVAELACLMPLLPVEPHNLQCIARAIASSDTMLPAQRAAILDGAPDYADFTGEEGRTTICGYAKHGIHLINPKKWYPKYLINPGQKIINAELYNWILSFESYGQGELLCQIGMSSGGANHCVLINLTLRCVFDPSRAVSVPLRRDLLMEQIEMASIQRCYKLTNHQPREYRSHE